MPSEYETIEPAADRGRDRPDTALRAQFVKSETMRKYAANFFAVMTSSSVSRRSTTSSGKGSPYRRFAPEMQRSRRYSSSLVPSGPRTQGG